MKIHDHLVVLILIIILIYLINKKQTHTFVFYGILLCALLNIAGYVLEYKE